VMRGIVNPDLEPALLLSAVGPSGRTEQVLCVIDTGFSGALALPLAIIASLALAPLAPRVVRLADGSQKTIDTYEVEVLWDGSPRALRVLALDGESLIGTLLLKGHDVSVGFVDGGDVLIQRRP
jgi:clan AA aspartic protease